MTKKAEKIFFKYNIFLVLPLIFSIFTLNNNQTYAQGAETYRQLNLFGEVFERVRREYVEEVSDEELIESAINGMLQSLAPHSSYMTAKIFKEMQVQTKGEFGGLGIEVTMENGFVKVVSPIDDTPAARAGVQSGDFITHIDGESVLGLTLSEAVEKMRGQVKTKIIIKIARDGVEPFEVTIIRDIIKIRSVRSKAENNVAYIRITSFTQKTSESLLEEYKNLESEIGPDLAGVIIDLRNNPGGLLDQAVAVSDAFLNRGEIVSTRGRRSASDQRFNATPGDITDGLPIVVMINSGSASASEIVAGALQDHERALILGTSSFGKGSVQTIMPVVGDGAMRLTTARYYTPSGNSIQAKGIEPDIFVPQANLELVNPNAVRRESDLRGHLDDSGSVDDSNESDLEEVSEEIKNEAEETPEVNTDNNTDLETDDLIPNGENENSTKSDYQLNRAIDLVKAISIYQKRSQ